MYLNLVRYGTSRIHQKLWFASSFELSRPAIDLSSVVVNTIGVLDLSCRAFLAKGCFLRRTYLPRIASLKNSRKTGRTKKKRRLKITKRKKKVSKSCQVLEEMVRMTNMFVQCACMQCIGSDWFDCFVLRSLESCLKTACRLRSVAVLFSIWCSF